MKMPKLLPEKKLKATARRVPQKVMEQYEEEEEPVMKFSSAFVVVLLLHVTAFGGICAFNKIKANRVSAPYERTSSAVETKPEQPPIAQSAAVQGEIVPVANQTTTAPVAMVSKKPATSQTAPASLKTNESPAVSHEAPAQSEPHVADSGTIYTTVKGDNPVTIAHHFGVSYDELLRLNNIENPKKLQIGQKLHIPVKQKN